MKIFLSGVTREERLDLLAEAGVKDLVLDFSVAKKFDLEDLELKLSQFDHIMLEYDLSSTWSRIKYLWAESDDRHEKVVEKYGSLEQAQEHELSKLEKKAVEYLNFSKEIEHLVDVIWLPSLPITWGLDYQKVIDSPKLGHLYILSNNFSELIYQFSYIGFPSDLDLQDLKDLIKPHIPSLKAFEVKLHRWGRVDKETCLSGAFWSASSSNWISGSKNGTTFEYVGNLKLTTYHGSKGAGKGIRKKLKAKCETLGLDHNLLMSDERRTVNLWNLHQWIKYSLDVDKVGGYYTKREDTMSDSKLPVLHNQQKTELASASQIGNYLRSCNSCYLSESCPLFENDATCRITSTPKVETPEDVQDLLNQIIQIQGERVLFASMSERVQNAGINPEVSKEMETLTKLMKDAKEITSVGGGDEVTIKAKGSGVISRLFGGYGRSGGGSKPSTSENIIDVSPMESDDD